MNTHTSRDTQDSLTDAQESVCVCVCGTVMDPPVNLHRVSGFRLQTPLNMMKMRRESNHSEEEQSDDDHFIPPGMFLHFITFS